MHGGFRGRRLRALLLTVSVAALGALFVAPARATESGASIYLLGSGGPEAAVMPPIEGVFFNNVVYYYTGEAGGGANFPIGGNIVVDLEAEVLADFPTVLWVPTTDLGGATLALGAAIPFGQPDVTVSAVITGPLGGQVGVSRSDDAFVVGDPILLAMVGLKQGNLHVQASSMVNIPIGDYREGQLANLAFHRWAVDFSLAATWHDDASGWDVSGKAGITFNGENEETDYDSGTELHFEASVERTFSEAWSAGLQAYHLTQVSDDSGAGARLGGFRGEVSGIGANVSYRFQLGRAPIALRLRAFSEFDATNRLEGESYWFELSMPLHVNMPTGAGAQ